MWVGPCPVGDAKATVRFYVLVYCLLQFLYVLYTIMQSFLELQRTCFRRQPKTVRVTSLLSLTSCPLTSAMCASTGKAVVSDAAGVKVCPCWPWSFPELVELPRCLQIHQPWEHFRYKLSSTPLIYPLAS